MGRVGPAGLFAYLAFVLAALGVFTSARMLLRSEVPRDQRGATVAATSTPPRTAAALDEQAAGASALQPGLAETLSPSD